MEIAGLQLRMLLAARAMHCKLSTDTRCSLVRVIAAVYLFLLFSALSFPFVIGFPVRALTLRKRGERRMSWRRRSQPAGVGTRKPQANEGRSSIVRPHTHIKTSLFAFAIALLNAVRKGAKRGALYQFKPASFHPFNTLTDAEILLREF